MYTTRKMTYVKLIQDIIDRVQDVAKERNVEIHVISTFEDVVESTSCIMNRENTNQYGLVCLNVEGYDEPINFFTFNGKLYEYCKAEGFSRDQMVSDKCFENKVLVKATEQEFIDCIINND